MCLIVPLSTFLRIWMTAVCKKDLKFKAKLAMILSLTKSSQTMKKKVR